ncbi:hypothetical protein F4703DRAFT_1913565 [Phycomyces blakesleeanus]
MPDLIYKPLAVNRQTPLPLPLACVAANLSSGNDRQLYTHVIALSSTIQARIDDLKNLDADTSEYFNSLNQTHIDTHSDTDRLSGATLYESSSLSSPKLKDQSDNALEIKPLLSSSLPCFGILKILENTPVQSIQPTPVPPYNPTYQSCTYPQVKKPPEIVLESSTSFSTSCSLTPKSSTNQSHCVQITHVKKKINGFIGLFNRTHQLSHIIISSTLVPPGLCEATDILGIQKKAVLKLTLTTFNCPPQSDFTFHWSNKTPYYLSSSFSSSSGSSSYSSYPSVLKKPSADTKLSNLSDSLVRSQLIKWVDEQAILPPLKSASDLFRSKLKIYVVYDRNLFQH